MKGQKSYIFQAFAIVVMAGAFFLFFKGNLPKRLFAEEKKESKNVVIDNLLLEALADQENAEVQHSTVESKTLDKEGEDAAQSSHEIKESLAVITESESTFKGMHFLSYFYKQLQELQKNSKKRVRIAYYGDSMTDGDLIVQDIRRSFQDKYGGTGVGFIPITVESSQSRGSVTHRYSPNWKVQSYLNVKKPIKPFGVSGQVFFVKDSIKTWVSLRAGNIAHATSLITPTLYYGKSNNVSGQVLVEIGKDTLSKKLMPSRLLNTLKLTDKSVRDIRVNFVNADSIPIYGIDVSSANGVQVDNFSSRGNSGLPLSLFNANVMHRFQKELDYSLIILHYGTNVLNYGSLNYSWYTKQMSRVVSQLRNSFPNAAILIISTADKSTKYDLVMQTDSAVVPLVRAQRKYAMETQTGFVDLYQAMGGKGSMVNWVESTPSRANKDYTHFNARGAREIAALIFKQIEEGYNQFKKDHNLGDNVSKDKVVEE